MRIAEEGVDAEGLVKLVMLGELVSIVEADGFAYRLWEFSELTSDGPGGEDSFSINRVLDDAEAGLSFVENQQPLAASGEQHEVGFPMARRLAAFDLGGGGGGGKAVVFVCGGGGGRGVAPRFFLGGEASG